MDILSFTVKGFRNITSVRVDMDRVTGLVGANGYGKSNVISAIEFGINFIQSNSKETMMSYKKGIPLLKNHAGMDYSFEIEAQNGSQMLRYGFSFAWKTISEKSEIKEEHLFIKTISGTNQYNTYIRRDGSDAKYRSSEKGRCSVVLPVKSDELLINKLRNFDNLFYIDVINALNSIGFYVEKHLDSNPSYEPDVLILNRGEKLSGLKEFKNIPRTIWEIKKQDEKKYNILIDSFRLLFPFITKLECTEHQISIENPPAEFDKASGIMFSENIYTLSVKDDRLTQIINFDSLSDGTKRVFLALTFALLADIKGLSVIVFEEPENSVHPSLLQAYLRVLDRLSGDCKIIFTSHSPYMVQYLPIEDIYIGLNNKFGQVDFRKIIKPGAVQKQADKYNQTIGDLIFNYISFDNANDILEEYVSSPADEIELDESDEENWIDSIMTKDGNGK